MLDKLQFYIDGKWVDPVTPKTLEVINPANEEPFARISLGSKADVDKAVAAAQKAFDTWSRTTKEERLAAAAEDRRESIRSIMPRSCRRSARRWARRLAFPRMRRPRWALRISRRP